MRYLPQTREIEAFFDFVGGHVRRLLRRSVRTTGRITVVLWGKPDCSLCDKAEAILSRLARDFSLDVEKRDISNQPEVFERHRYVIPVVEFVNGPTFEGKITEHRLRRMLLDRRLELSRD